MTFHTRSDGVLNEDENAPDPYCLQLLRGFDAISPTYFYNYVDSLLLKPDSDVVAPGLEAVLWLGTSSGLS